MNNLRNLILLTQSNVWPSAIGRQEWPIRLSLAISIEDLLLEAARRPGSVAVVEFSGKPPTLQFGQLAELTNTPYDLGLLAVGNFMIARWRELLISVGFDEVFGSTTEVGRLGELAHRHFDAVGASSDSLEHRIQLDLPWKPVMSSP